MMEIQSQLMENISSLNLTFYNGSFTIHYQPPNLNTSVLVIFLIVYTAVVLVGIGGNIVVCFTIFKMKNCTVTNFFMANLASSDILMAAICIPFTILSNLVFHYWAFGAAMCPIVGFLQVTSVLQRAFTLVVITYDQHQMVWHPLRERFRKRNARVLICILWFCAAIASLPVAMYASIVEFPKDEGTIGICMENWEDPSQKRLYSVIIMILQYFLPLAIMTVCYTHIGFIIWLKKMPGEIDRTRDHNQLKSKKRVSIFIIVNFIQSHCFGFVYYCKFCGYYSVLFAMLFVFCVCV